MMDRFIDIISLLAKHSETKMPVWYIDGHNIYSVSVLDERAEHPEAPCIIISGPDGRISLKMKSTKDALIAAKKLVSASEIIKAGAIEDYEGMMKRTLEKALSE